MSFKVSYYDSLVFGSGLFGRMFSLMASEECVALPSDPSLRETLKIPRIFWKKKEFKAALEELDVDMDEGVVPIQFYESNSLLDPSPELYRRYSEKIYGQGVKRSLPPSVDTLRVDIVKVWSLPTIHSIVPSCPVKVGNFGLEFETDKGGVITSKIISTVHPSVLQPFFKFDDYDLSREEEDILNYNSSIFHPLKLMGCKLVSGSRLSDLDQMIVYVIESDFAFRIWVNPMNSYLIDRKVLYELGLHKTDVILEFKPPGSSYVERRILKVGADVILKIFGIDAVLKEEWYTVLRRGKLTMEPKDVNSMRNLTLGGRIRYVGRNALGTRILLSDIPNIVKEV